MLVGVWTEGTLRDAERSLAELAAPRRDRRLGGRRRPRSSAATDPDPATYIGSGKAQELRDGSWSTRRRHRDRRRRAHARPAAPARGGRQGQGRRPHLADPRHLRPARAQPGGQGAGLARADAVPAPAPARLGRVALAPGRWRRRLRRRRRHARPRRDQDRDRPPAHQHLDGQAAPRDQGDEDRARHPARRPSSPRRAERRDRRLHQRGQVQRCSTGSPVRACSSTTRCSPPSTPRCARRRRPAAATSPSPTPSASCATCRTSSSRRSARRSRRWPRPT